MWKFTVSNSLGLYENPKFKFKEGINVLIGPNGTGKTFLLSEIQWKSVGTRDSDYIAVSYSNLRDGGDHATDTFGFENDIESLAFMVTSSEGQGIYRAFGEQFFKRIGSKLIEEQEKDKKRDTLVLTLDSMDSGLDIYYMREILNLFEKVMLDDIPKKYTFIKHIIVIISTNSYEFVRGRDVIDTLTGKSMRFASYEDYADHIIATKEKIFERNKRLEEEERED